MTLVHFGVFLLLLTTCPNSLPWLLDDPLPLWTYATFTQNLAIVLSGSFGPNWMGVTWSLALEIQFYIVILVVVRMLPPRLLPCILLAGIAISTLIRPALALAFGPIAAYVLLPARADALFLGSLLAWAAQHPPTHEWLTNHRRLVLPTLATLGGVIAFMVAMNWGVLSWAMSVGGYSIIAVFYATLLLGVMVGRPRLGLLLDRRWLQRLGVISFSVYLWHQPVNGLIRATGASGWTAVGLATAFTLALSTLTWRWVEVPFIALGHKVPFRRQSNAPTRPLLTP